MVPTGEWFRWESWRGSERAQKGFETVQKRFGALQ
jgi:hypothetical protein